MAAIEKYKKAAEAGDNEFTGFVNYAVKKKVEGSYKLKRILMIIAYVVVDIAYASVFLVLTKFPAFVMFVPLLTWAMVYFTWPYVNIEYEYTIVGGLLTMREVYGGRYSKVICEARVSAMSPIKPFESDSELEKIDEAHRYICVSSADAPDRYLACWDECALIFEATEKTLKIMKYYNPDVIVTKTRY